MPQDRADPDEGRQTGFGPELRRVRLAKGVSLAQLASKVHYSKSQLSKIENGLAPAGLQLALSCDEALDAAGVLVEAISEDPGSKRPRGVPEFGFGLPPNPGHFVGRRDEMRLLTELLAASSAGIDGGTSRMLLIHGMPGVGKTALAVRAAHLAKSAYPDGHLFLDLHGFTPEMPPVSAADALDRCLRLLGVAGQAMPRHADDRAAMLRDRLRGRRVLMVLDNVAGPEQIRPLVPATPGCTVLATSRRRLPSLDEAVHVDLGLLSMDEAGALFRLVAGAELGEPEDSAAVDRILRRCGLLPLAIRIAAARMREGLFGALADLDRGLADDREYLAELDDGERTARAAFAVSVAGISLIERQMLIAAAAHPGPDFDAESATKMWDGRPAEGRRVLDRLVRAHLVGAPEAGRYRIHDLVRAYVGELDEAERDESERMAALSRLLDHYVATTADCDSVIAPHRYRPSLSDAEPTRPAPPTRAAAISWLEAGLDDLVAACRAGLDKGLHRRCWQLAHNLRGYCFLVKDWDRWTKTHQWGLIAARRDGSVIGEGHLLNGLGLALFESGDVDGAAELYDGALRLFERADDRLGQSSTLGNLAWVNVRRGEYEMAADRQLRALAFYEQLGATHNIAVTMRGLAVAETGLGLYRQAENHLRSARRSFAELGLSLDDAMALNCLGDLYAAQGRKPAAAESFERAIEAALACGSTYEAARGHEGVAFTAGDEAVRRRHLGVAVQLYESLAAPEADRLKRRRPAD